MSVKEDSNLKSSMIDPELHKHIYVVIMAGGKGERFWPLSTESEPKPFIKVMGDRTLIQMTAERATGISSVDRIFVVLGKNHLDVAKKQLETLPDENFIVEPEGRDTAACIGYSALMLLKRDKDAVMVVLPADQYVPDSENFVETINVAAKCATIGDYLITIGITPARPETGYGYINAHEILQDIKGEICYKVNRYVEKPNVETAKTYIRDGHYYWNSGIFVWQARVLIDGIARFMPGLYTCLLKLKDAISSNDSVKIESIYKGIQRKSIDYGLMEKAYNVLMVPAKFIWDDVGTWSSISRVMSSDSNGNCIKCHVINVDTKDCVIITEGFVTGTIGVSNLVIVVSKNGVLVSSVERVQEVREIVRRLLQ